MSFNPAKQGRQAGGKFGAGSGQASAPATVTGYVPIPPAMIKAAQAQIAAARAKALANTRLTPKQRQAAHVQTLARSIMAQRKRQALTKAHTAEAKAKAATAARARVVAGHTRAQALGTAAGTRTSVRDQGTVNTTTAGGHSVTTNKAVLARLRQYQAGR